MKVLKAGTRVVTVIGNIEAMVISVCITMDTVEYKIRWFSNGEEKIAWLCRFELKVAPIKRTAGFGSKEVSETYYEESLLIE